MGRGDKKTKGGRQMALLSEKDIAFVVGFHATFAIVAATGLAVCHLNNFPFGPTILVLVLGWNVTFAFSTFSSVPEHSTPSRLYTMWRFCAILSIFQVFPDWFLDKGLGALSFPPDGVWRIGGSVSCYMAFMWSIPALMILVSIDATTTLSSTTTTISATMTYVQAAITSLIIFGSAEYLLHPLDLWHCTGKVQHVILEHVAVYVLPAEAILGPALLFAYRSISSTTTAPPQGSSGIVSLVTAAIVIMLVYTGALSISYLLIETIR